MEALRGIMRDPGVDVSLRAIAVRALESKPREDFIPLLKEMATYANGVIATEAAIILFQWGEVDFALPVLKRIGKDGVALRRAFFKGMSDGEYKYAPEAAEFFRAAIKQKKPHPRFDAALGLLHLGDFKRALPIFQKGLSGSSEKPIRLIAVSYLKGASNLKQVQALLVKASEDKDNEVATRAKEILEQAIANERQ